MQKCPNCSKYTISNWDKCMHGPARMIECSNCKASLSLSWYSMVFVFAIIAALNILSSYVVRDLYLIIFLSSLVIYAIVAYRFIPLRIRKL